METLKNIHSFRMTKIGKTIDSKSSRPSPKNAKKPTKATPTNNKITISSKGAKDFVGVILYFLVAIGMGALTGGAAPAPAW